ncbi:ABC transporter ATP-binding protein [Youngiibacter multivorans]|uniref:ABC transport system ATP-binding protein n=1 Tax=Youngiibacter multivorans TaxID=937251 RepID=A0ABS4G4Q7_9CLOT|nr:ATP-binding cassette domain-containing protein [Youngiibacter multivorans]MBP1919548.1 putative ABC transport system ATP-binding protein [Youngiibacter multivorans]
MLEINNISYVADNKHILENISFAVGKGELMMVSGPSGSGKSTLLRIIGDQLSPTSGDIRFNGRNILEYRPEEYRQRVSYVFQTPTLFMHTVIEDLEFPYRIREMEPDLERIRELLPEVGLTEDILTKESRVISGGEKQRVALLRSLLISPDILLLDEVTASLDKENARMIEDTVRKLSERGITVIWVTHDQDQLGLSDRVLMIREGKVVESLA